MIGFDGHEWISRVERGEIVIGAIEENVPVPAMSRCNQSSIFLEAGRAVPEPTDPRPSSGRLAIEFAGESLICLSHRALYWPRQETLFVADLHLGKDRSMRRLGQAVPPGAHVDDLERLSRALLETSARRLIILGDLVHDATSLSPELDTALLAWRDRFPCLECGLIAGNHDRKANLRTERWGIESLNEPYPLGPFDCWHEPAGRAASSRPSLAGHLHPSLRIGPGRERLRLPCFWVRPECLILPSFGQLTGHHDVRPGPQDHVIVIAGDALHGVPNLTSF